MRAEAAGDPGPWRQQAILDRRDWDADGLRDIVRDYVIEHLANDDAVLVIDETGFLKQGLNGLKAPKHPKKNLHWVDVAFYTGLSHGRNKPRLTRAHYPHTLFRATVRDQLP
jgi:hypothetical protein